ncbi:hypothetical protein GQ457_10G003110 [Hibiscus cannabinus]
MASIEGTQKQRKDAKVEEKIAEEKKEKMKGTTTYKETGQVNIMDSVQDPPLKLGKPRKTSNMADPSAEPSNEPALPPETHDSELPPWWEKQQQLLESRFQGLENSTEENRSYLQRILDLMTKGAYEISSSSPEPTQQLTAQKLQKALGKTPVQVTVLNDHQKYTFESGAPRVLANKPPDPLHHPTSFPQHAQFQSQSHQPIHQRQYRNTNLDNTGTSFLRDPTTMDKHYAHSHGQFFPKPKLEIQLFEGTNPRSWIRKCEKYFSIFLVPENQKLDLASMYLTGKAEICNTVEEYQEKFEELKPLMLQQNSHLPETYFVSSFISGLKEEIRHKVKIHEPTTLADAYRKAKLYELSLEVESRKFKAPLRFNNTFMNNRISTQQSSLQPTLRTASPPRQTIIEYRQNNNLCFRCGDKFHPGQPCKQKHFNLMEEENDNQEELLQIQDSHSEQEDDKLEISMNALTGSVRYSTIRIQGTIKGNPVSILVDSGSTHSFITPGWAKEGLELVQTSPLIITVANGEKLHSTAKVKQLQWQMQGHSFLYYFRVLKMGGNDIVLGVDWMRTFSPILMDFKEMTFSFNKDGKDITLQGGKKQAYFKIISGEKLQKLATKDPDITGELYFLSAEEVDAETPEPLLPILSEYQDVFEEPKHLPPIRLHDHAIRLQPNTQPINLRPYMYSFQQKTELEKQISDLLASSIIQSSKSPFASPCLLVKKKDGDGDISGELVFDASSTMKAKPEESVWFEKLEGLGGQFVSDKLASLRSVFLKVWEFMSFSSKILDMNRTLLHIEVSDRSRDNTCLCSYKNIAAKTTSADVDATPAIRKRPQKLSRPRLFDETPGLESGQVASLSRTHEAEACGFECWFDSSIFATVFCKKQIDIRDFIESSGDTAIGTALDEEVMDIPSTNEPDRKPTLSLLFKSTFIVALDENENHEAPYDHHEPSQIAHHFLPCNSGPRKSLLIRCLRIQTVNPMKTKKQPLVIQRSDIDLLATIVVSPTTASTLDQPGHCKNRQVFGQALQMEHTCKQQDERTNPCLDVEDQLGFVVTMSGVEVREGHVDAAHPYLPNQGIHVKYHAHIDRDGGGGISRLSHRHYSDRQPDVDEETEGDE